MNDADIIINKLAILCKDCYSDSCILPNAKYINSTLPNVKALMMISDDKMTLYISVAGSDDVMDFMNDLHLRQICPDIDNNIDIDGIKFHIGFHNQFKSLLDEFMSIITAFITNSGKKVYLTGHSTGGCIASIMGFYLYHITSALIINVVTFGSPIFTNEAGADWFLEKMNYVRVINTKDPIPKISFFKNVIYKQIDSYIIFDRKDLDHSSCWSCFNILYRLFPKNDLAYHSINNYIL